VPLDQETAEPSSPTREACEDALARVLASQAFAKSARLTSFLRYVCMAALHGQADALCEQHIGVNVFDRPEHFNPADDTIVRTSARLLRQRLDQYYAGEGQADPVRIAIPRGAYVPVFVTAAPEPVPDAVPEPAAVAEAPAPAAPPRSGRRIGLVLGGGALLLLLAWAGLAFLRHTGPAPGSATSAFWAALMPPDRDTLFVVPDTGLVLYQLETRRAVTQDEYFASRVGENAVPAEPDRVAHFRARRYTGMSSVQLAAELGKRATAAPRRFHVRFARDLVLVDLKRANVIVGGVAQANPWWELFRPQMNFHIDWDPRNTGRFLIRNDHPRTGEQATYEFEIDDPHKRGFATIAYTHGLGGDGRALLLGGTTSAGTEAAIEFLVNPAYIEPVLRQATRADGSIGDFEVLLQCVLQANGSTDIQVVAVRTRHE
jgi:hypothetical protein